ncbi:MAG: hypothetical protein HYT03_03175 [Candidatus Harrisonbacteria bacterium]|nr:hypothetical protein [Candidatus Harrisonbacteria bacterium]
MKLEIKNFSDNLSNKMRSAGYHYEGEDQRTGELKFYRSLSSGAYPRFHIYCRIDRQSGDLNINLHLDQKAPVYRGSAAHAGEYDGEVVEKEGGRLKQILL